MALIFRLFFSLVNAENVQIPLMPNNSLNATLDNASETFRSLHTATMISNDEGRIAQIQEKLIGVTVRHLFLLLYTGFFDFIYII